MESKPEIDTDTLGPIVSRVFRIEDTTLGDPKKNYIVRYRGRLLLEDTEEAYDRLAGQLKPMGITPLFRWEEERQAVILVPGMPQPKASNPWINLGLFFLTLLSVLFTGAMYGMQSDLPNGAGQIAWALISRGWPFAVSMLGILAAHEFGHYLMGRKHGLNVTLPYFIPFPFSPFGTMGAFINMKSIPKNRRHLFDVGVAGPLAGLIVSIPVLIIGLMLSKVETLPMQVLPTISIQVEGNSILYLLSKFAVFGQLLPQPASYQNVPALFYWLRYFFTATPIPLGGRDVMLHSVAWAGWAGLLVTSMNLIPAGQLDGGHILYVLFGREKSKKVFPFIIGGLVLLGFAWNGWWLWAALVFFVGRAYAEPLDQITDLDGKRRLIGLLALAIFILAFTPVPLNSF